MSLFSRLLQKFLTEPPVGTVIMAAGLRDLNVTTDQRALSLHTGDGSTVFAAFPRLLHLVPEPALEPRERNHFNVNHR